MSAVARFAGGSPRFGPQRHRRQKGATVLNLRGKASRHYINLLLDRGAAIRRGSPAREAGDTGCHGNQNATSRETSLALWGKPRNSICVIFGQERKPAAT